MKKCCEAKGDVDILNRFNKVLPKFAARMVMMSGGDEMDIKGVHIRFLCSLDCEIREEVCEVVKPDVCLWCTPEWLWNNDMGDGYNTYLFLTVEVRSWMDEISPNRKDYVTKDGECIIVL